MKKSIIKTGTTAAEKNLFTTIKICDKIITEVQKLSGIDWNIQQYNYLYVIHRIIYEITSKKGQTTGCKINMEYLAKLFGKSHQETSAIKNNLIKWGIIVQTGKALKGQSAKYLISSTYSIDNILTITVSASDIRFIQKLIEEDNKTIYDDKFLSQSLNIFKSSISINNEGLDYFNSKYINIKSSFNSNYINNSYLSNSNKNNNIYLPIDGCSLQEHQILAQKTRILGNILSDKISGGSIIEQRDIPLFLILKGEFYCTRPVDRNGNKSRVYNNLTNLPREHRKYVDFDNKPLLMTDISNSQILLTIPQIFKYYKIHSGKGVAGMPKDVIKFKELAESGKFYEEFGKLLTPTKLDSEQRSELKKMVFKCLWFGPNKKFVTKIKSTFRKEFPNVFKYIKINKVEDYKQFSIKLQHFESQIMIDDVAKKMLKLGKQVLTLHDAIVTSNEQDLETAEEYIAEAMAKHNIAPKFKRENSSQGEMGNIILEEIKEENVETATSPRLSLAINMDRKLLEKKIFISDVKELKKVYWQRKNIGYNFVINMK